MNNIEKLSKIDPAKLSTEFYFQSLLQEAFIQGELSQNESERIQLECLKLLAESTERYTKGQSSSVRVEIAQGIMTSNFFTISLYLKSLPDLATALFQIVNEPIEKLYADGHAILKRKINVAHYFFHLVVKTKLKTPNQAYNLTIDQGFKPFFESYDINFHAHEIPSDIDYQLIHPVTNQAGVEFIIQYLENLYYENLFCSYFDAAVIDEVMYGYDQGYAYLLDNISEQILQNALGCQLLNKPLNSLDFSPAELDYLKNKFVTTTQAALQQHLKTATSEIIATLDITHPSLKKYLLSSLPKITATVYKGMATASLNKVLVPRDFPRRKASIHYNMGIKMDDTLFREIVGEILSCRFFVDKLALIKESIHTLADMEDLLIASELSPVEAAMVFDLLEDIELAVLAKRHPLHPEIAAVDFTAAEICLQQHINSYLQALPGERQARILNMIPTIEVA